LWEEKVIAWVRAVLDLQEEVGYTKRQEEMTGIKGRKDHENKRCGRDRRQPSTTTSRNNNENAQS
jgi:hypothetical protein